MARIRTIGPAVVFSGIILFTTGCAFLTAQRVGTFAAKQVGTHVVKKAIKSQKEEDERKKREKAQRERAKSEEKQDSERGDDLQGAEE